MRSSFCAVTYDLERYEAYQDQLTADAEREEYEREIYRRKRCKCGRFFSPAYAGNFQCRACHAKMCAKMMEGK